MSIIYDALKKVENKKSNTNAPASKESSQTPSINKNNPRGKRFFVYLLIAFLVVIFSFLAVKNISKKDNAKSRDKNRHSAMPVTKNIAATSLAPSKDVVTYPLYTLEGIVYDSEAPVAIVNGKMVKKADRIDDFEVTEINPAEVKLRNIKDGTTLLLSL